MPHRPIVILIALFFAIGVPVIYFVAKARAAASLDRLLAGRFSSRPCPVANIVVPSGGSVCLHSAYDDARGSRFILVLGHWARGSVRVGAGMADVNQRVAGLFRAGDTAWLERLRVEPERGGGGAAQRTPREGRAARRRAPVRARVARVRGDRPRAVSAFDPFRELVLGQAARPVVVSQQLDDALAVPIPRAQARALRP